MGKTLFCVYNYDLMSKKKYPVSKKSNCMILVIRKNNPNVNHNIHILIKKIISNENIKYCANQ